jgi:hypothetical protein
MSKVLRILFIGIMSIFIISAVYMLIAVFANGKPLLHMLYVWGISGVSSIMSILIYIISNEYKSKQKKIMD